MAKNLTTAGVRESQNKYKQDIITDSYQFARR